MRKWQENFYYTFWHCDIIKENNVTIHLIMFGRQRYQPTSLAISSFRSLAVGWMSLFGRTDNKTYSKNMIYCWRGEWPTGCESNQGKYKMNFMMMRMFITNETCETWDTCLCEWLNARMNKWTLMELLWKQWDNCSSNYRPVGFSLKQLQAGNSGELVIVPPKVMKSIK